MPSTSIGPVMELVEQPPRRMPQDGDAAASRRTSNSRSRRSVGLRTRLMNSTSGEAIMHHTFYDYSRRAAASRRALNGVMVSTETGRATPFAMDNLQERVTRCSSRRASRSTRSRSWRSTGRDNDLPVNICREKKLTNFRRDRGRQGGDPQAAAAADAGGGPGVHRGRRVGGNHAQRQSELRKTYLKENDRKHELRQGQISLAATLRGRAPGDARILFAGGTPDSPGEGRG